MDPKGRYIYGQFDLLLKILVHILGLEVCTTPHQFQQYDEIYYKLAANLKVDIEATGCLFPALTHGMKWDSPGSHHSDTLG